jgi:hypothetical protein
MPETAKVLFTVFVAVLCVPLIAVIIKMIYGWTKDFFNEGKVKKGYNDALKRLIAENISEKKLKRFKEQWGSRDDII